MYYEYLSLIIFIFIYAIFLRKNNFDYYFILIFIFSIIIKLFLIYLEHTNIYINNYTFRDETTFISYALSNEIRYNIFNITPGDNFLVFILKSFYLIFKNETTIKLVPILFSIISFHYVIKICQLLKYNENYTVIIVILFCFWPSNILFHYSVTKEFLQLAFMTSTIYYSCKIINKFNLIIILKLLIALILFTFSHRGFELVSVILITFLFNLILLKNKRIRLSYKVSIISFFMLLIIGIISIYGSNNYFTNNILRTNFLEWFNNIRVSNNFSKNNYVIILESMSFGDIFQMALKSFIYYFYYLPNLKSIPNLYYFIEIILNSIFFLSIFYYLIRKFSYQDDQLSLNFYYFLIIILIYFIINLGFAIFNFNIGNAIRHKSVSSFIIFIFYPVYLNMFRSLISKSSIN